MIRVFSEARNQRGFTLLELLVVASIIAIIAAIAIPSLLNAKRSAWESRAKVTIRSYGETQLAYQNTNNDHHWGSWQALKDTDYLARGYHRVNIIENYSLYTNTVNVSDLDSLNFGTGISDNTFTVVGFPRTTTPPGYLATFAIREDQVLRVYRPDTPNVLAWGENGDLGTRTWDPIS